MHIFTSRGHRSSNEHPKLSQPTISNDIDHAQTLKYSGVAQNLFRRSGPTKQNLPLQGSPIAIGPHGGKNEPITAVTGRGSLSYPSQTQGASWIMLPSPLSRSQHLQSQAAGTTIRSCKIQPTYATLEIDGTRGEGVGLMSPGASPADVWPALSLSPVSGTFFPTLIPAALGKYAQ